MEKETRILQTAPELRGDGDTKAPTIEGHAALFDTDSEEMFGFVERIAPDAFEWDDVRALFNHDPNQILARTKAGTLELRQDKKGLLYSFDPPDTTAGRDLVENIRNGNISQSSFAFAVKDETWELNEDGPDVRTIRKAEVFDVSPVTYPAYADTTVALRSLEKFREAVGAPVEDHRRNARKARVHIIDRHLQAWQMEKKS